MEDHHQKHWRGGLLLTIMTITKILAVFSDHHRRNPLIWEYFEKFALEIAYSGREYYSAQAVYNRIRWHVDIEVDRDVDFRMKSGHIAYYSRMFHVVHPEYDGFFRTSQLSATATNFMGEEMEADETEILAMLKNIYETGGTRIVAENDCI